MSNFAEHQQKHKNRHGYQLACDYEPDPLPKTNPRTRHLNQLMRIGLDVLQ
jgi:hypothetical protein